MSVLRAAATLLPRRRGPGLPAREVTAEVEVGLDRLASYSRICGFPVRDRLPGTFPHVLSFSLVMDLMTGPDFPFPVVGLVHVAQRVTVHRPLTFDRMRFSVRASDLRPHHRGQQFDVVTVGSVEDSVVWEGVSTYLRISGRSPSSGRSPDDRPARTATWRVPARTGRDYAAVSGDHNPIHTSRLGARLFGFPRPIAHGMWTMARCLAALDARVPAAYTMDVDFRRPLLLPSTVGFSATPIDGGWAFEVDSHLAGRVSAL
ncbi:MaoC/PaaZ C-terminal domain-containing protein [Actinoplanes sp. NPDC051470]|uniref:MaoC family dehydratase n=1 Tax=unclassified Actinoplanes TaxID=2626549 RepID=UPI00343325C1